MSDKFYQLINLPPLPKEIIADGLSDGFEYTVSPYAYAKRAALFHETEFCKLLKHRFGTIGAKYLKNAPNSFYDWHTDKIRNCSLNWIIKASSGAKTFYRDKNHNKFFWNLEEVIYNVSCPTLLDTTQEHCVFNNSPDERTILSVSILDGQSYQDVLEFLQTLNISNY